MIRNKLFQITILISLFCTSALCQAQITTVPLLSQTGGSTLIFLTSIYNGNYDMFKGIPSGLSSRNSIIRFSEIKSSGDTLYMIIGDLNETERICVIDADRDKNFSNDFWYIYNNALLTYKTVFQAQPLIYSDNAKRRDARFIRPEPFNRSFSFNGPDKELQIKYYLSIGISDYYVGNVRINNQSCSMVVYPNGFRNLNDVDGFSYAILDSTVDVTDFRMINRKPKDYVTTFDGFILQPLAVSDNYSSLTLSISPISKERTAGSTGVEANLFAPFFKKQDLKNSIVDLESFKGKYVLLDFWGTWCTPCVKLLPHIGEIHNKYKDLNILSIALEMNQDGVNKLPDFISKYQMFWTNICDKDFLTEEKICSLYKVSSFPTTILIDPQGKIIHRGGYGEIQSLDLKLEQIFQQK